MIYQVIGIIGSMLIIYAFYSIQKKECNKYYYNIINLIGAILLSISLINNPNIGSIIIEFFWIIISVYGIKKYYR